MTTIPFTVNDAGLRRRFLEHLFPDILGRLDESTNAQWGKMSAQHMVEHLLYTFEISTGKLTVECRMPEKLLDRVKRFLQNDSQTPQNFKNPLLGENPPPLRFAGYREAVDRLKEESKRFLEHSRENPQSAHIHPLFGPLGVEEWERAHFKHCYHHLVQFGLIELTLSPAANSLG